MKTKNFLQTVIVIIPLLISSCSSTPDYDATGIFEATTVTLSAETTGRIMSVDVAEGDSVRAGETVAVIDTALLSLQRKQLISMQSASEASSPDIQAQVASMRTRIAHQENECRRIERLLADGAATQKQSDDAQAQLRALRDERDALLSTLSKNRSSISNNAASLQYQREQTEEQIGRSVIVSPLAGTVLIRYVEPGEFAVPGKPMVKLADLDKVYLRAYFTASQLADVRVGQKVTVIADFGADKRYEYPGMVTWIAQESEFTPKSIQTSDSRANLVYAVKVAVKNDGRLKLGQYGEVRL